jgi:hypothetical protein
MADFRGKHVEKVLREPGVGVILSKPLEWQRTGPVVAWSRPNFFKKGLARSELV